MNYRHDFHAGNFADVVKHAALTSILLYLRRKDKPFAVIDTHAGAGLYDIAGGDAARTGEAQDGILRLADVEGLPGTLQEYRAIVRGVGEGRYPGSPLVALRLLRQRDRLAAIEKHPDAFARLSETLKGDTRARAILGDGYRDVLKLVPPPERRGLVLVDPPYEDEDEFPRAAEAIARILRKFATAVVVWWYPLKSHGPVESAVGHLLNEGVPDLVRLSLDVGQVMREAGRETLTATGLLVVNAPYGFVEDMNQVLPFLAKTLGRGPSASASVTRLAGD